MYDGKQRDIVVTHEQVYDSYRRQYVVKKVLQSVTPANGDFVYEAITPITTPYGETKIVENKGVVEQRVTVGKASFRVTSGKNGETSNTSTRRAPHTRARRASAPTSSCPKEDAHAHRRRQGERGGSPSSKVVGTAARIRPTTRSPASTRTGRSSARVAQPLQTVYGLADLVVRNGALLQRIKVGKHELFAEEKKDGSVLLRDANGKASSGAVRVEGGMLTPQGFAARVETTKGPRDVVLAKDRWNNEQLSTVRYEQGNFTYEPIETITTERGTSRPVVRDGRLVQELEIDGKPYSVVRRGGGVRYVDKKGEEYKDNYVETLKAGSELKKTTIKSPLAKGKLPRIPDEPIARIVAPNGAVTEHMSKETYNQLRDAMIETMKKFDPRTHYFIGLGSDPHPIIAFLDELGGRKLAVNFPASGKYNNGLDPKVLDPYVRRLIPAEVLNGSKTLVFLDQTTSSAGREGTLAQITRVFEQYLQQNGSKAKVKKLAYSPNMHPDDTAVIDTNKYPEVGTFLGYPYEHVVSQYDRHVLGQNTPDQLIERPQYNEFKSAIGERMKRDPVLDKFLTGLATKK